MAMHYDVVGYYACNQALGRDVVNKTRDEKKVNCKHCIRILKKMQAAELPSAQDYGVFEKR